MNQHQPIVSELRSAIAELEQEIEQLDEQKAETKNAMRSYQRALKSVAEMECQKARSKEGDHEHDGV
jgi:exonuclease VII small subunit